MSLFDLAIVGAGAAGMAAAREGAEAGMSVALIDEQPRAGGQVYRNVARAARPMGEVLGEHYVQGAPLAAALEHEGITHFAGHALCGIEGGWLALSSVEGGCRIHARNVLLATGAIERPMPVPGWTLPGVMTVGAAQVMLKQSGVAVENAVLVGSGPLLHLVAVQLVRAGTPPKALVETRKRGDARRAMLMWRLALRATPYVKRSIADLVAVRNAGVARYMASRDVALLGERRVEAVAFSSGGRRREVPCEAVLLHHGVIPHLQASRAAGVPEVWNEGQQAFVPVCDTWGRTEVPHVWVAGDGAWIGGARAAELSGRIAALGIAHDLGYVRSAERDRRTAGWFEEREFELSLRPVVERAFPPYPAALAPADGVTLCRCEEVTAGEVRNAVRSGAQGANQIKVMTRAGMGRCQGRMCGDGVARILADERGTLMGDVAPLGVRPPIKPITLGALAQMHHDAQHAEEEGGDD
ncbi:NADPH-dependent 2,4-dienoyl-CoA reductase/sulfur reductase-like enzyme [Shimia isoporae]|uniref:NADPH-dependent 2,4-dienoyl-CoA reductase/sulfur reductase-like enzyme n=1 Tax=Shimia isoporae TaxID=647720 RepID=A0A4R1NAT2_9RHOB|nr:NAD(P)/FAD-dependent oxidoreductase [Shimia isoporae]TCL01219.1 NADPH-dependent 2,4-dienoyl-CoA reductase/sulfur reductase-like enzyme [Shimia isoporae]